MSDYYRFILSVNNATHQDPKADDDTALTGPSTQRAKETDDDYLDLKLWLT